jgi:hypothetical protein
MLPSRKQWNTWTLPSKYSLLGLLLGGIGIVVGLFGLFIKDAEVKDDEIPYVTKRMSRIEFLTQTIDRLLPNVELVEPLKDPYLDVQAQYKFAKYVVFAYKAGFINPPRQLSPRFDPEREITRGELSKILARAMCFAKHGNGNCFHLNKHIAHLYEDMDEKTQFSAYVSFLIHQGVFDGKGKFYSQHPISKKDASLLIEKAVGYL